jgi:uncharacterized protein (TIGR00730 family)
MKQPRKRKVRDPEVDRVILSLWNVIDDLERLLPSQSRWYRVTIFGSSRIARGDALFETAKDLAFQLTHLGCDIVTGGGPGLMEAANEGAQAGDLAGKTKSYGLHIELPYEYEPNKYLDTVATHRTFFSRLHHFVRLSHAYVVLPGGIGTSLETFMIWQLLQVGYLIDWMRKEMASRGTLNLDEIEIPKVVESIEGAVQIIKAHKAKWDEAMRSVAAATSKKLGVQ